jgi:hypothetical protein
VIVSGGSGRVVSSDRVVEPPALVVCRMLSPIEWRGPSATLAHLHRSTGVAEEQVLVHSA